MDILFDIQRGSDELIKNIKSSDGHLITYCPPLMQSLVLVLQLKAIVVTNIPESLRALLLILLRAYLAHVGVADPRLPQVAEGADVGPTIIIAENDITGDSVSILKY